MLIDHVCHVSSRLRSLQGTMRELHSRLQIIATLQIWDQKVVGQIGFDRVVECEGILRSIQQHS